MTTPATARRASVAEHGFYVGMAIALFATVWIGFARSFFMRPLFPEWIAPTEPIFFVHGVAFAAWFVLLIVQPSLVATGRADVHRVLGRFGVALATVMVVVGMVAALTAATRETGFFRIPAPPLKFLAIPFVDMLVFPVMVGMAVARRNQPQSHKRWMLIASIALVAAPIARWPYVIDHPSPLLFFGLTDAFLLPLVIWDLVSRGRLHPVTLWGGALLIGSQVFRVWILTKPAWDRFATWLVGFVA
jgi:hypothetical protein